MSKIRVDTVAAQDDSSSVTTATLTALPGRMTAAETNKANKGANSDITSLSGLTTPLSVGQGGTGGSTADAARSALGISGRNRIINGACSVSQRPSAAFGTGVGGYAGPDRFLGSNTASAGGQFTQSQGTIVDGGVTKFAVVQTVNTAIASTASLNYWSGIVQYIEGFNCFDLVGSPVAVSFLFKTNVTGTFSVAVRDSTGTVGYNTSFAATSGVPVRVTINIPAVPLTAVVPQSNATGMQVWVGSLNTGTYQAPATNVWNTGNYVSVPSATNWGATAGNYISLTELQFEAGTVTPFERRSYAHDLSVCQRYYYRIGAGMPVGMGHFRGSTTNASFLLKHPTTMRASPTTSASSAAAFNVYTNNGAPLSNSYSATVSSPDNIWVDVGSSVAATAGWPAMLVVAAGGWVDCSSEL